MNGIEEESPWDEEGTTTDADWERLRERYTNTGYREGITAGKLSTVQSGFDAGYAMGARAGRELGILRGRAAYLLARSLATQAPPDRIERCRELVRDLGRLSPEDVMGPDHEAIEHAREHGEVDMDELSGGMAAMASRRGPTLDECRLRLEQLVNG